MREVGFGRRRRAGGTMSRAGATGLGVVPRPRRRAAARIELPFAARIALAVPSRIRGALLRRLDVLVGDGALRLGWRALRQAEGKQLVAQGFAHGRVVRNAWLNSAAAAARPQHRG